MKDESILLSKVLVLDSEAEDSGILKALCEENALVAIRPQRAGRASVMEILGSNIDLGGIMIHDNFGGPLHGIPLARAIRGLRPELPIFLRRDQRPDLEDLGGADASMFRCVYTFADLAVLQASLDASIFNRIYPTTLVRGITEMTRASLTSLFHDCEVTVEAPYLVKDRLVYGEVFTLISLESSWCRGYMMLQASEDELLSLMPDAGGGQRLDAIALRELNSMLGEATNMIWGAFKNRYLGGGKPGENAHIQVPIIVNHQQRFISFGSEDPQLSLRYTLRNRLHAGRAPVSIYQRFIFNLNWAPEEMTETSAVESVFESGELEVF